MESTIPNEIKSLKSQTKTLNLSTREILNVDEAIAFLQLSRSCLYKKTSQKQIPYYKPPGCKRIYFRKVDLENWILNSKVDSVMETESITENYLFNTLKIKNHG